MSSRKVLKIYSRGFSYPPSIRIKMIMCWVVGQFTNLMHDMATLRQPSLPLR